MSSQQLLFQAADGKHFAAQRDFAGHRDVAAHRDLGQRAGERRGHGDAGRRAILRDRAFGHVHVDIDVAIEVAWQARAAAARERT